MGLTHDDMQFPDLSFTEEKGVHAALGRMAAGTCPHAVQFYEDEGLFLDSLSHFVGGALGTGGACVIIANQPRREHPHKVYLN
ncbi:MAG TPA: hypothetical protein VMU71_06955 [Terracidiphilus sp.]|nr:hypothetical protein [Terracidiphilus sp.]